MYDIHTIKVNFKGGLISPGDLLQLLTIATTAGISQVSFGLRQQLLMQVAGENLPAFKKKLQQFKISYELNRDHYPNISSSFPAAGAFIPKTWLSEGVYKDIFDSFNYQPILKINICDSKQSLTPLITGNINWVASSHPHFWYLVIRFPKTNKIFYWQDLVYTNDVAAISKKIEYTIIKNRQTFYDNTNADGNRLYEMVMSDAHYIIKPPEQQLQLPPFMLPYYEGLNKYHENKSWLGIYRRDEQFSIRFLVDLCMLCLHTKIGQVCSTPWKSLIIKGIEDKDRESWNSLLGRHQINVRHAANELNFQVEDNCKAGLDIKSFLVKHLSQDDTRTFGICMGIKTRKKSEVFSNVMVKRKSLFTIGDYGFFTVYDILFAENFNPNARTGKVFSRNNIKLFLPKQLRRAIVAYYDHAIANNKKMATDIISLKKEISKITTEKICHQCQQCLSMYDEAVGEPDRGIAAGTAFEHLPLEYTCATCDEPKAGFKAITVKKEKAVASH